MGTFNPVQFKFAMQKMPDQLAANLQKHLGDYGRWFATNRMPRQVNSAMRGSRGRLAGSFRSRISGKKINTIRMRVFTASKYAAIQEFGGTIRPKNRQWLTIPMPAVLTKTGRARGSAGDYYDEPGHTWVQRDPDDGQLYIWRQSEAKGRGKVLAYKIEKLFRLVKSVTLKPRLGFRKTFEDERPGYLQALEKATRESLMDFGKP